MTISRTDPFTPGVILTSTDGLRWTVRQAGGRENPYAVVFGGDRFVAVGDSGAIWTSTNGTHWTQRESGVDVCLFTVSFGNGYFLATGESNTTISSTDGVRWTHNVPSQHTAVEPLGSACDSFKNRTKVHRHLRPVILRLVLTPLIPGSNHPPIVA